MVASLTEDEYAIIAKYPLNEIDLFRYAQQSLKSAAISENGGFSESDPNFKEAASVLLSALTGPALHLSSRTGKRNMYSDIRSVNTRIEEGDFDYEHYNTLSRLVIIKALDAEIWNAVINIIVTLSQTSPPPSIAPTYLATPTTYCSNLQEGSEQTNDLLEKPLLHEIKNCTYRVVTGFFSKYFEGKEWTERSKEIYNTVKSQHVGGKWINIPSPPEETAVFTWIRRLLEDFISEAENIYCHTKDSSELTGTEPRRQLDVFIKPRAAHHSDAKHDWKDILVVGELQASNTKFNKKLLQLSRYVREVFTAQPTRRFVHGFTFLGTSMEFWVFDRSGPYSSGPFDIHTHPETCIRAMLGYVMMSEEELGLDTFIEREDAGLFINATDATGTKLRVQLSTPLIVQRAIVCRGTNCYDTADSSCVVKFSWASDKQLSEINLLKTAHEKGVKGVVKLLTHHQITSIEQLREGLTFPAPFHFKTPSSPSQLKKPSSRSVGSRRATSIDQSASRVSSRDSNSSSHHARLMSQSSKRRQEVLQAPEDMRLRKRESQSDNRKPSKRSKSNSQTSSLHQEVEKSPAIESAQAARVSGESFKQRLFNCLTISPVGKALSKSESIPQLLTALRDAIKAHKSLFYEGNILHRDISENNIIITDPMKADGFTGMLIDLDLAVHVDGERTGARQMTGTLQFMAIQVLRAADHTYRHDLESFFYVLLWICARRAWEWNFECKQGDRPKRDVLKNWYRRDYEDIADDKTLRMSKDGFQSVLRQFPQAFNCVQPLCRTIRAVLFDRGEPGVLHLDTLPNPSELYDPILQAFDDALDDIASTEGSLG